MQHVNHNRQGFWALFATNFWGVLNDNFLKSLAAFVALGWIGSGRAQSVFMGAAAGALVLPYILFSPLADRLAAVFEKKRILRAAKVAELPVMAVASAGFALKSPGIVLASVLLMGLQSSLYSPAKYALVRDVGGEGRISQGMGGMEAVAFAGVLAGTVLASLAADYAPEWAWHVAFFAFALAGLGCSLTVRAEEVTSRRFHSMNPVRFFRRARRMAAKIDGMNATICALGVFWWTAATLQMGLVVYARQAMGLDAVRAAAILSAAAVGIVLGSAVAGWVDARRPLIGHCLATGWIAAAILAVLFFVPMPFVPFTALVAVLAFDLGFFKLPLDADIQKRVKGPKLNTILAYFNQVTFLFMLAASLTYSAASALAGPKAFLAMLAVAMAVAPLWFTLRHRIALIRAGRFVLFARYRVEVSGDAIPQDPCLVLPNHPAMADPMLVGVTLQSLDLRPLADEYFLARGGVSGRVLKTLGAIPVPDLRKRATRAGAGAAKALTGIVADALADGHSVIFYPSGHIWTSPREEIGTRQLAHNVCRSLPPGVRVLAVRTTGLWGSIWSRKGRQTTPPFALTFVKSVLLWPLCAIFRIRRRVTMHFEDVTDRVREWAALPRLEFNRRLEDWYNATPAQP